MPTKQKRTRTTNIKKPKQIIPSMLSPLHRLHKATKTHKHIALATAALILFASPFAYVRYQDWDNAQMISGLAQDFPRLVADIEQATGLDIAVQSNCGSTQEKFNAGVRTCELIAASAGTDQQLTAAYDVIFSDGVFPTTDPFRNGRGYLATYRNKNSCTLRNTERIAISCITAVRGANSQLARDSFSEFVPFAY